MNYRQPSAEDRRAVKAFEKGIKPWNGISWSDSSRHDVRRVRENNALFTLQHSDRARRKEGRKRRRWNRKLGGGSKQDKALFWKDCCGLQLIINFVLTLANNLGCGAAACRTRVTTRYY
jgi:hypothetical protein